MHKTQKEPVGFPAGSFFVCAAGTPSFSWVNLETGIEQGDRARFQLPILNQTTVYRATVSDAAAGRQYEVRILATANPLFRDRNSDGCNDIHDLWALASTWNTFMEDDADGNRRIDVKDLLYVNIAPQTPCTVR